MTVKKALVSNETKDYRLKYCYDELDKLWRECHRINGRIERLLDFLGVTEISVQAQTTLQRRKK